MSTATGPSLAEATAQKGSDLSTLELQAVSSTGPHVCPRKRLKAIHRKVDWRVVVWYSFVFVILRIDASNISNTAIINEERHHDILSQLHLGSQQWAWVLTIFHFPYGLLEPVSTLLLKRFKPNVWMGRIMITWGIVVMCQAAVQNYAGLLACRFMLGLAEAGFFPGVLFHLSFWYPADELALRIACFCAFGHTSGMISGALAFGISFMDGLGGLAAWRWLFILEGIPAILCGLYTYFMLPNYPDEQATFLTTEEQQIIAASIPRTQPKGHAKTWNFAQVKALLRDPTFPTFTSMWVLHSIGAGGISSVLPTVFYRLGLTNSAITQLMTIPAFAIGCCCLFLLGWLIHSKNLRVWPVAVSLEIFTCICYIVLITVDDPIVKYVFVILAMCAALCIVPILWPERIRAAHGTTGAGLAIGLTNAAGQIQGFVGPQVYQPKFGPDYQVSFTISTGLLAGATVSILATWYLVAKQDRITAERESSEQVGNREEIVEEKS